MKFKKIALVAVVALVLWYIVSAPAQSAEGANGILSWLRDSAESVVVFVRAAFA